MKIKQHKRVERITFGNLCPGDAFYIEYLTASLLMKMEQDSPDAPNAVSLDDGLVYKLGGEDYVDLVENIEVIVY